MPEDAESFLGVKSQSESRGSPAAAPPPSPSSKPTSFEKTLGVIIAVVGAFILAIGAEGIAEERGGLGILFLGLVTFSLGIRMTRKQETIGHNMSNDTPKSPPVPPQQEQDSGLARASGMLGIASIIFMAGCIFSRLLFGSGRIGLTAYGERLFQFGVPFPLATALDFGNASDVMLLAMLLGFIAVILGIIAIFLKGRKTRAKIGLVTGGLVVLVPVLLPLL